MSNGDNLTAVLDRAIRNRLAEVQTCMPGIIVSYNFKTQKASVQPAINRRYADGLVVKYDPIENVPVIFPRTGGASMTFPVKKGDTVLLLFAARTIERWRGRGGQVDQDDNRMHSLNDAIAIPGLVPFNVGSMAKNNNDVLLTYGGAEVEIKPTGEIRMKSPQRVYMDAPEVRITGDLVVEQDIYDLNKEFGTFNRIRDIYNSHTHNENDVPNNTDVPNQLLGVLE